MYRSSPLTFMFKYVFPFLMIGGGVLAFTFMYQSEANATGYFALAFGTALLWMSILFIQLAFRLKRIVANEDGIIIRQRSKDYFVGYEQMESISWFDLVNPMGLTISYLDVNSNLKRKIAYLPNSKYQRFFKEDQMTEFIRNRIKERNPEYDDLNQPSTIRNLFILSAMFLPILLVILFFVSKT